MFPFCPRNPWTTILPHVSTRSPILPCLLSADHPRIQRPPNNRQDQGHYVTDEQCIHTPANMIIRCLGNNKHLSIIRHTVSTLLRTLPCDRNWNIVIYILVIAYVGETQTSKNIQLHLIKRFHHSAIAATKRISFLEGCKKEESCGMVFSSNLKFYAASRIRTYARRSHLISSQTP